MEELKPRFEQACFHLNTLASRCKEDTLLYLYARYKQATTGKCSINRPGLFDFSGKKKWDAWNALDNLSAEDAMHQYVQKIEEIDPDWVYDCNASGQSANFPGWVAVSTLGAPEDEVPDAEKTVWDWCKQGDVTQLTLHLTNHNINNTDDEGMTLLHWASDRGHKPIVECLVGSRADVSLQDSDGQTPLHYAASCGHSEIVKYLLANGADRRISDSDGLTPIDVADSDLIKELLT